MGQQINVAVVREQLEKKLFGLVNGLKTYEELSKKYEEERKVLSAKFDKDLEKWEQAAFKIVLKSSVYHKSLVGTTREYMPVPTTFTVRLEVELDSLPPRPNRDDYYPKMTRPSYGELVPEYYDHLHRRIHSDAAIGHFRKALEMLDALPQGTVEITVKNYDFLMKF